MRYRKCKYCKGIGFVQIAPFVRGIKKCPYCNGKGKIPITLPVK